MNQMEESSGRNEAILKKISASYPEAQREPDEVTTSPRGSAADLDQGFEVTQTCMTLRLTHTSLRRESIRLSSGDSYNIWDIARRRIHQPQAWIQKTKEVGYRGTNEVREHSLTTTEADLGKHGLSRLRIQIWLQTEQCIKLRGYDLPKGEWIPLKLQPVTTRISWKISVHSVGSMTRQAPSGRYWVNMPSDMDRPALPTNVTCNVNITNTDCLQEAEAHALGGAKVAVLNMANEKNAGGGFRSGAGAQEENLHRRSDMFRFLWGRRNVLYPLETGEAIISEGVTVFRGPEESGYPFLEKPFRVTIISCAALYRPLLRTRYSNIGDEGEPEMETEAADDMRVRIKTILYAAERSECDTIILSAFGCGAFRCPPGHVALIFRQEILANTMAYSRKKVIFAIFNDHNTGGFHNPSGNFQPFWDTFQDLSEGPNTLGKRKRTRPADQEGVEAADNMQPEEPENSQSRIQLERTPAHDSIPQGRAAAFMTKAMQKGGLHKMLNTTYRNGEEMYKAFLQDKRMDQKEAEKDKVASQQAEIPFCPGVNMIVELCEVCGKYPKHPESYSGGSGDVRGPVCCNKCRETQGQHHGKRCTQHMQPDALVLPNHVVVYPPPRV